MALGTSKAAAKRGPFRPGKVFCLALALLLLNLTGLAHPAFALDPNLKPEIEKTGENAAPPLDGPQVGPDGGLPDPAPVIRRDGSTDDTATDGTDEPAPSGSDESAAPAGPQPEVLHDLSALPEPVARLRQLLITAAKTGNPEALRPLLGKGPTATKLSLNDLDGDPVDYLKSISGDGEGLEILAIMLDILDSSFVHVDTGTADDMYVWPSFAERDLDQLKAADTVELLRIVTAGDLDDMHAAGNYNFFRIGITPDGEWRYFISGD